MKAIFAVTALAAAISAQATAADTEITTTLTGGMDAAFILDLNADPLTYDVDLIEDEDDDDGVGYDLDLDWEITNGPLSASLGIEAYDVDNADGGDLEDAVQLTVGDIVVTDGALSFGQVGSLMSTDEYTGDMVDDDTLTVDAGFTYAVSDELTVQIQGENDDVGTHTGFAAQYAGSADAISYVVEAEVAISGPGADADLDPAYFAGAGLTYSGDAFTAAFALNTFGDAAGVTDTEYAFDLSTTVAGATATATFTEYSTETEDDELLELSLAYAIDDSYTASAGYDYTTAEEAGDEVWGNLTYASGPVEASVEVTVADFDADEAADPLIELDYSYTTDLDIVYYAGFDFQTDAANALTLGASYNF